MEQERQLYYGRLAETLYWLEINYEEDSKLFNYRLEYEDEVLIFEGTEPTFRHLLADIQDELEMRGAPASAIEAVDGITPQIQPKIQDDKEILIGYRKIKLAPGLTAVINTTLHDTEIRVDKDETPPRSLFQVITDDTSSALAALVCWLEIQAAETEIALKTAKTLKFKD